MDQNVKNCEESETITYLQANSLCCPNFMDTQRSYKVPESETKYDLLATEIVVAREASFALIPQAPIYTGWYKEY